MTEPIIKDHNRTDPGDPLVIRSFPTNDVPQYAIKCSAVTQAYWCLMPVGYDVRNIDMEIRVRDLYDLPNAATVISRIQGVQGSTKVHLRDAQWQPHIADIGFQHAVIEVFDAEGFLILGLQKQFEVSQDSFTLWEPTATLTPNIKETYDGPVEDCPRLQGTFTIDIKGLFNGLAPEIPVEDNNAAMVIDKQTIQMLSHEKLSNEPLIVDGETIRNCNVAEGEFGLGFVIEHIDETGTGFYAFIENSATNVDNRWPSFVWNRTDMSANPECPPFPTNMDITGIAGRPDTQQTFRAVPPGDKRLFLGRYETRYDVEWFDTSGRFLNSLQFDYPWILDEKATYNGTQQWIHAWVGLTCSTSSAGFQGYSTPATSGIIAETINREELVSPFLNKGVRRIKESVTPLD